MMMQQSKSVEDENDNNVINNYNDCVDDDDDDSTKMDPALPEDLPCLKFNFGDNSDSDINSVVKTVSITTEGDNDIDLTDDPTDTSTCEYNNMSTQIAFHIEDSSDSEISDESEEEDVELFLTMLALNSNNDDDEEEKYNHDSNQQKNNTDDLIDDESEHHDDVNTNFDIPHMPKRNSKIKWEDMDNDDLRSSMIAVKNTVLERSRSISAGDDYLSRRHSMMALRSTVLERARSVGGVQLGEPGRMSRKLVASMYEPSRASIIKVKELQEAKNRRRKSDATCTEKSVLSRKERFQSLLTNDKQQQQSSATTTKWSSESSEF